MKSAECKMNYLRSLVLAIFSIVFVLPITNCAADIAVGGTGSSNAATRVLVMGEDSNPSSVARGNNIFKRVLGELKNMPDNICNEKFLSPDTARKAKFQNCILTLFL